ncbi:hypothetical protein GCM10018962_74780 [Dactylosporangium matsuzakiense]
MLTSFGGGGVTGGAAGAASEDSSMAPAVTAWNMDPPRGSALNTMTRSLYGVEASQCCRSAMTARTVVEG